MSVAARIAEIDAVQSVVETWVKKVPSSIPGTGTLYHGSLAWAYLDEGLAKTDGHEILVVDFGLEGQEAAYWLNSLPNILRPEPADAYILGRTAAAAQNPKRPFTAAEVESFCNTQWRATSGNAAALAIKGFGVENIDANTIKVHGYFHDVAANTRPRLTFFITLVNPNAAASGANVKFEKVIE